MITGRGALAASASHTWRREGGVPQNETGKLLVGRTTRPQDKQSAGRQRLEYPPPNRRGAAGSGRILNQLAPGLKRGVAQALQSPPTTNPPVGNPNPPPRVKRSAVWHPHFLPNPPNHQPPNTHPNPPTNPPPTSRVKAWGGLASEVSPMRTVGFTSFTADSRSGQACSTSWM